MYAVHRGDDEQGRGVNNASQNLPKKPVFTTQENAGNENMSTFTRPRTVSIQVRFNVIRKLDAQRGAHVGHRLVDANEDLDVCCQFR